MAVSNLFSHSNKNKAQDGRDVKEKKRKVLPRTQGVKRLSLQHDEESQTVMEQINYLTQAGGRRGSVFAALANELTTAGNVPVSPMLEQTSVADFIRLLSSLQAKLEPSLSLPPDTNRRNSAINYPKDYVSNSLSMLFSNTSVITQGGLLQPPGIPQQDHRRLSMSTKTANFLTVDNQQRRRFSLIPPMDVDHPFGQVNFVEGLRLKRRSTSSHNINESEIPATNLSAGFLRQKVQRPSLTGAAKYISSKLQNPLDAQKSGQSNSTSDGFRRFLVRRVSITDKPSEGKSTKIVPASIPNVPTITIENVDGETTREEHNEDDLQGIVVVRL